ncbi:MAG: hypothetical protein J6X55_03240 [Victivallales bacterium]|nr:hypothetical protein [Victivallales bacterium]
MISFPFCGQSGSYCKFVPKTENSIPARPVFLCSGRAFLYVPDMGIMPRDTHPFLFPML